MTILDKPSDAASSTLAIALTFVAGNVDGLTLFAIGRFSSHMSGTTSTFVDDLIKGRSTSVAIALGALGAFWSGAALVGFVARHNAGRNRRAFPLLLMLQSFVLFGTSLSGLMPTQSTVLLLLSVFAMGMQNGTSSLFLGDQVRTTHVTGTLTDIGTAAGQILAADSSLSSLHSERQTLTQSTTRLLAFVCGGAVGALAYAETGSFGLLLAAVISAACATAAKPA